MTHFDRLQKLVPGLAGARILDVGSGKGKFLVEAATRGATVTGLEYNQAYISETEDRAQKAGVSARVLKGEGETLPFPDGSFDFVNMSEVIEHVRDPKQVMSEVSRVLAPGGHAYVSVPNRFGFVDQHFHLPLVNWLPRAWADAFITLFGSHKNYSDHSAGLQRLCDMHYYTFRTAHSLFVSHGFSARDIRELRIVHEYPVWYRWIVFALYIPLRFCYFDAFHFLLARDR